MQIIQYGSCLTEQDEIKSFLKSIGSIKCRCMITFKTLWEENKWLVRGYMPHDEKLITSSHYDNTHAEVYDINLEKHIKVPVEDIERLEINESCHIVLTK